MAPQLVTNNERLEATTGASHEEADLRPFTFRQEEFTSFHFKINHCSQHTYEKADAVKLTGMFAM